MRTLKFILVLLNMTMISTVYASQDAKISKMIGKVVKNFDRIDSNNDGELCKDELSAVIPEEKAAKIESHLKSIDKDNNGKYSKAELKAAGK